MTKQEMQPQFWIATMDTPHYSWIATGETKRAARKALLDRFQIHMSNFNEKKWPFNRDLEHNEVDDYYGLYCYLVTLGKGYMDSESECDFYGNPIKTV
jgi:hypothetical protein